jgi:Peptidase inhibitor family I36
MARTTLMALLAGAVLTVPSPLTAQEWGRGPTPRSGVCFYKDPDFSGDYFCVRAGDNVREMPHGMNDKVTSIQIFGRAEVTVFQDSRFEGRSSRFNYDVRDLRREGWSDLISSFRVDGSSYGHNHGGGFGYSGDPDVIVRRAYQDVLNREPDQQGLRLYRSRIIDDGWTEKDVRDALRGSPEYRQQSMMTYPKAQEVVRQAYLNVLRRAPDSGASGYVNKVYRDHWTQQDVERELRKSPEYRKR